MFFFTGASTSLQARRLPISFTLFWYTFHSFYFCFCVTVIHFYPVVFPFFLPICAVSSATGSDFLHLRLLRIRSGTIAHELLWHLSHSFSCSNLSAGQHKLFFQRKIRSLLSSAFFLLFIIFLIMPQRNFPIFCTPEIKSLLNLWDLLLVSAISFFCLYTLRNPRRNRKSASTATEWKCS